MKPGLLLTAVLVSFFLLSCIEDRLSADLPAYISIEKVTFTAGADQGTNHQLITEVWIYADSQFIGSYASTSQFPLLANGPLKLDVFPGIRENGQALAPVIYPMMTQDQIIVATEPGKTTVIDPSFRYSDRVIITINEDFENTNIFTVDLDGDTLTRFKRSDSHSIEGISATASLNEENQLLEVASKIHFGSTLNPNQPVFLEMEYLSETPLAVGIRKAGATNAIYKLILFANQSSSQKIYVNFTDEIQSLGPGAYEILFRASFTTDLAKPDQAVTIDNIKLLHFRP